MATLATSCLIGFFFILAGNRDMHKSLDEFGISANQCIILWPVFLILAGNKDMHMSFDEFVF